MLSIDGALSGGETGSKTMTANVIKSVKASNARPTATEVSRGVDVDVEATEPLSPTEVLDVTQEVARMVGDDGTGDIGIIVREALRENPRATYGEIAEIVREARRDHTANVAADRAEE